LPIGNRPDREAVSSALKTAVFQDKFDIVKMFCGLTVTDICPSRKVVAEALKEAAHFGQSEMVQILCGLETENRPDSEDVSAALELAAKNQQWKIVQILCCLKTNNRPNRKAVSTALQEAVYCRKFDIVKELCCLKTDNRPDRQFILNLLKVVASDGKWDILEKFCICILTTDNKPSRSEFCELTKNRRSNSLQFEKIEKVSILYESINELLKYGDKAKGFAEELKRHADEFVTSIFSENDDSQENALIKGDALKEKLAQGGEEVGNHCSSLSVLLKNITIALREINAIVLGANINNPQNSSSQTVLKMQQRYRQLKVRDLLLAVFAPQNFPLLAAEKVNLLREVGYIVGMTVTEDKLKTQVLSDALAAPFDQLQGTSDIFVWECRKLLQNNAPVIKAISSNSKQLTAQHYRNLASGNTPFHKQLAMQFVSSTIFTRMIQRAHPSNLGSPGIAGKLANFYAYIA
jgi:hypothetical protein